MHRNRCPACGVSVELLTHPEFSYAVCDGAPGCPKIIIILDEGHEKRMTVTNGVRCVLAIIAESFSLNLDHVDIIYMDSRGVFDRILTKNSRFAAFKTLTAGPEITHPIEALDALRAIQKDRLECAARVLQGL